MKHVDLLIRFGEACGVSRAAGARPRGSCRPRARSPPGATRRRGGRSTSPPPACWWGSSRRCPASTSATCRPLKTHYGFNDREVEFFAIHIEADEVHGERGYQIVERHCTTPPRKAEALDQVRQATEMRWQYMSGLHRAFVAQGGPVSEVRGPRALAADLTPGQPVSVDARRHAVVLVRIGERGARARRRVRAPGRAARRGHAEAARGWRARGTAGCTTCAPASACSPRAAAPVPSYPVRVEGDEVLVELP